MSVSTGLLPSSRETYSVLKAVGLDGMERAEALPSCSTSVLVRRVLKYGTARWRSPVRYMLLYASPLSSHLAAAK